MSTGSKNSKGLIFLVAILLLSNIGLLWYFLSYKKSQHDHRPPPNSAGKGGDFSIVDYMKKEVGFNEEQARQFLLLHEQNRDSLKVIGDQIRINKNNLYKLLERTPPAADSTVKSAILSLSTQQQRMEWTMFHHFQRVRNICTEEQQVRFDSMIVRMNNRPSGYRRPGQSRQDSSRKK